MAQFSLAIIDPLILVATAALLAALSGIPALFTGKAPATGQWLALSLILASSLIGLAGAGTVLVSGNTTAWLISWSLPFGPGEVAIDGVSALFLLPIFLISACSAIYATGYRSAARNPRGWRKLLIFSGLLSSAMALLVIARSSILFLMAWEVMALSCYFVMTAEDNKPTVREAGTLYMIITHIGTLALFAMFSLLRLASGSFLFPAAGSLDGGLPLAAGIFVTALIGFGLKAGLMPLHVWLPSAHANAPSHISALMSGVLIKMGIYGLIRAFSFFSHLPLWWGITVLVAGITSGVLGVIFALGQHDIKRLLAYHSIENIGIITMGIGIALIGQATNNALLVTLGMGGALLHTMNHALFKALLFFGAGAVTHAVHTREIDRMGGLAKQMPWTAALFLIGAAAICGLPPLNGFVSEFLVYLGLFNGVIRGSSAAVPVMALAIPALALIGALAVACFVKVFGIAFLGLPRVSPPPAATEQGWLMRAPMVVLATLCILIGVLPQIAVKVLEPALRAWAPTPAAGSTLAGAAPLGWLTFFALLLLMLTALLAVIFRQRLKTAGAATSLTWDCGYIKPAPSMQYTASSFVGTLVTLFSTVLRPHVEKPVINGTTPHGSRFASHVPEAVLELLVLPFCRIVDEKFAVARRLQHGQLHLYILYIFVTLILLLVWALQSG